MSAPTPAPGDDRPREGYYPDPSIPGYVRYWNGASWVPGTSRPAPQDGETLAPPPGAGQSGAAASVEETGPHFFDEDPVEEPSAADSQHGSRPEPASAWGADRSHQSGFGGQDRRVSWGSPPVAQETGGQGADPRVAHADGGPSGESARTEGTANVPPAAADQESGAAAAGNTFVFRRPTGKSGGEQGASAEAPDEGTMTFRAVPPRTGPGGAVSGGAASGGGPAGSGFGAQAGGSGGGSGGGSAGPGFGAQSPAAGPGAGPAGSGFGPAAPADPSNRPGFGAAAPADPSNRPGFGAGKAAAARAAAAQSGPGGAGAQASAAPTALSGPQSAPVVPPQSGAPASSAATPLAAGPGGGQSSWAQQVHRLAGAGGGDEQPVAPWKPPVEDPFQAAARRQAAARPAGLGKRLVARLLDTVVLAGLTAGAAVPLGIKAVDHVDEKIDAAKLSGETVTVWLLDGTTSVYLGIVLAVLLLVGVVAEVLPTVKWGRTLGKKLMGLEVRDIEGHEAPEFGAALRRWLVYSVPGLLVVGIVGVVWCVFDKPWRQCWHDKAAHTFVAG
ncbi:RDD family protein [Streptomyces sp. NPDC006372]|uniref:RDD family protein n=1 Tax=Streptomyces sp. NPDC006372 TaxID=3155599 RepID=UPI0033BE7316